MERERNNHPWHGVRRAFLGGTGYPILRISFDSLSAVAVLL
jgi:hypothetical protein